MTPHLTQTLAEAAAATTSPGIAAVAERLADASVDVTEEAA